MIARCVAWRNQARWLPAGERRAQASQARVHELTTAASILLSSGSRRCVRADASMSCWSIFSNADLESGRLRSSEVRDAFANRSPRVAPSIRGRLLGEERSK